MAEPPSYLSATRLIVPGCGVGVCTSGIVPASSSRRTSWTVVPLLGGLGRGQEVIYE